MIIVNQTELRSSLKKYLDLAEKETVIIKRGKKLIELVIREGEISKEDMEKGLTGQQVLKEVSNNINKFDNK